MEMQRYQHRDYVIEVEPKPPSWQARIYGNKPNLPIIDTTKETIIAVNLKGAEMLAKRRIDETLAALRCEACNGTGFKPVVQPSRKGTPIRPPQTCSFCGGSGYRPART